MNKQLKTLPDLSQSFRLMIFAIELETVSPSTVLGAAILAAIEEGRVRDAVEMVADCAADNRAMVADIVGSDLLNDILKFVNK